MRTLRSSGRFLLVVLSTLAAARCYRPGAAESCKVTCNAAAHEACPDNMSCEADGLCHAPGDTCGGGPRPDAISPDAFLPDGSAGAPCFGSNSYVHVCLDSMPSGDVNLTTAINTSGTNPTGCVTATNTIDQQEVCVVVGDSIEVSGIVSATGTRPLVLVATSTITIDNGDKLSVASTGGTHGAGANLDCPPLTSTSGGGGPGGSHGMNFGGSGGPSYAGSYALPMAGGSGFVGGCDGMAGDTGGPGGRGGGAVFLIASQKIAELGMIDASGTGGGGASGEVAMDGQGGGGGGAGGLIGFDAPMVELNTTTRLLALGGGGGGGACDSTLSSPGSSPSTSTCNPAAGGSGNTGATYAGGAGGAAAGDSMAPGAGNGPTGAACGGGGGGGARGVIVLPAVATPLGTLCGQIVP